MFPLPLLAWETDATLRAMITESVQASLAPLGAPSLFSGGELACDARAAGPRSLYTAEARARVARGFSLAAGGGPPDDSLDADAAASATWTLSPLSTLALTTQGSLATTWGIRADSLMLTRDPFLDAQRLEYGFGADLAWTGTSSPVSELNVDAGFAQEGALAADDPVVVGADSREAHGGVSYSVDVTPRMSITPEVRYAFTRYEHALLDVDRHRGRADVHRVSLLLGGARELTPQLAVTASTGLTVASPMPIAATRAPEVAPELGLGLRYRGRRAQITARYAAAYTSLGPRIGLGFQHSVTVRFTAWPFAAADVPGAVLRGLVRATHGAAPIGADPPPPIPGMPPPPLTGSLVTTSLAGRATLEIPFARGWSMTTGLDLMLSRGHLDPVPPGGEPRQAFTGILTLGLAATVSTDRRRLYTRDPGAEEDEAARRDGAMGRLDNRTIVDQGRAEER